MFRLVVWRDLILAWRRRADVLATLFFFVMVVSLFPLSMEPDTRLLRTIAPGVVWVAALLASMLSLGRLFANDHVDGTLEQMLLTPQPLYFIVLGKVLAQWLVSEVPLVLITPEVNRVNTSQRHRMHKDRMRPQRGAESHDVAHVATSLPGLTRQSRAERNQMPGSSPGMTIRVLTQCFLRKVSRAMTVP